MAESRGMEGRGPPSPAVTCRYCGKRLAFPSRRRLLERVLALLTGDQTRPYRCRWCGQRFWLPVESEGETASEEPPGS